MVSYMEWATQFTYDYGDMWEQYYDSVENNFDKTIKFIVTNGLWENILKGFNSALNGRTDVVMALQMPWPTCMRMAMLCIKTLQRNNPTTQMSDVGIKKMFGK